MPDTLYVIDGHLHIYQAFYAIRSAHLTAPDGQPVNAVYGFTLMLRKILRRKPTYIAVAFDSRAPTFRHRQFKDYKAHRPPMPEELSQQIPLIREIIQAHNIPIIEKPGYEADDLIGALAKRGSEQGLDTVILTRDKDVLQLLDEHVTIYDNKKDALINVETLRREKGISPEQVVEYLALAGDATDNVPGVPGIGEKTALALIQEFGSLEGVLSHIDKVSGTKRRENLKEFAEQARLSKRLTVLDTDAPVEPDLEELRYQGENREELLAIFKRLAFQTFLKQMVDESLEEASAEYHLVNEAEAFKELVAQLGKLSGFAFDVETTSTFPMEAQLVGLSFAWQPGEAFYVPVRAPKGEHTLPPDEVLASLKPILENSKIEKWGQNLKYDMLVLRNQGVCVEGVTFDTMLASWLLAPDRRRHNLDNLAADFLSYRTIPITDLLGTGKQQKQMDEVPTATVAPYAGEDAEVSLRLKEVLANQLQEKGLDQLYRDLELPILSVLAEMEWQGVKVDVSVLENLRVELEARLAELEERIYEGSGTQFNIDSTKQLQQVLFQDLKLPRARRTKTGYSTDSEVLEELSLYHELPTLVLEYRQLSKLKNTYVEALPRMINPRTGRIHASFNQTGTATGRLSSSDPNLQNIPIRSEEGGRIRAAFIPADGHLMVSADYSQIELRLLAHFSQDERLLDAFARGEDIHAYVAAQIHDVDSAEVTPQMRRAAKAVNFGIIYGLSPYGLSRGLGISVKDAAQFIDSYYQRYPGVEKLLEKVLEEAQERGYVSTILGRRRYVKGIKNIQGHNRNPSERAAINSVMQGSAADLIKVAMINIHRRITDEKRPSHLLLQIHDELVFEVPEASVAEEQEMIQKEMAEALPLSVPIEVNVQTGRNWLEVK